MKIAKIEFTNYGPFYGTHTFSFDSRGLLLVMGDNQDEPRMNSNGSGKSHIFDALDWCLFGKSPRGDHADSVRNDEAKSCSVTTYLVDDNGRPASITRGRAAKNELRFFVDGVEATALDSNETQKAIEVFLGLDRDVFHAAVLFGQTDLVHYADSSDSERMTTLTKILQLDDIDNMLLVVKDRLGKINSNVSKLETQLAVQEGLLEELRRADFRDRIEAWDRSRAEDVTRLKVRLSENENELAVPGLEVSGIPQMEAEVSRLVMEQGQLRGPDSSVVRTLQDTLTRTRGTRDAQVTRLRELSGRINGYRLELAKPQPVCVECGTAVSREHVETKLATVVAEHQDAELQIRDLNEQVLNTETQCNQALAQREQLEAVYREQYNGYTRAIGDLHSKIDTVRISQAQRDKIVRAVQELRASIERREREVNPFVMQQHENQARIAGVTDSVAELGRQLKTVREETRYLEFWVTGLGPKGLKSYILDFRLQELTDAANQWVRVLTGGTIWVQFESQKQRRDKKIVNSPDVRVFRWNPDGTVTERNFRSWSGGEKQRISFALDFGLSRLIANRAKHRYDLLILDEVFRHLDRRGKEAVMDMLGELSREKNSVIVVEHDTDFQDSFESRVIVRKKDRRSIILEENDEQATKKEISTDISVGGVVSGRPVRSPVARVGAKS